MASPTAAASGSSSSREGTAKAMVFDQISQTIQSTSNLLHLMQQSSPSQVQLTKLPKNLLAKTTMIKNTGQVCIRADASGYFLPRCTCGEWITKCSSSQNCFPAACKYGELPT
ncbi:hypothetical protein CISIN_1g045450mg [Citrus sinensis]|uniref:Uncharacterized protein n=1 Tax=Citrus sinensis TaxID=2711 RepID=A0A067ESE9_CITSI|nr:hypothetical protein CISIN_1g045450mg [Citrus sinensis]